MPAKYVLVTAARNEELFIEETIRSVIAQTVRPEKWVIVNDNSIDLTEQIAEHYSLKYDFIQLLNKKTDNTRNTASKVFAIHLGLERLYGMDYDLIGNIDADLEFGPTYFECLLEKFKENRTLGIAGGWIYEVRNGIFRERSGNSSRSVPGAVQMFRRECFETIGRYLPIKTGGEDCVAEIMARMNGWTVRSFSDLRVNHKRPTSSEGTNKLGSFYRQGKEDYFVGYLPFYHLLKCLRRIKAKPFIIGSLVELIGYLSGLLSNEPMIVPQYVKDYFQKEQKNRINSLINIGKVLL